MMMTTSMVANATFYLRGGYSSDSPGWSSNRFALQQLDDDRFYIDFKVESLFEFKLYYVAPGLEDGVWIGSTAGGYNNGVESVPYTFTGVRPGEGENMIITKTGNFRFIYNTATFELLITPVPCPVEVATDLVNGTVTVDKTEAGAGETVTITVTPDYGYGASSSDVNIELTADPGVFNAPSKAPAVGQIFHPYGDAQATHDNPATFTFTMPQYPFGVYINVNFQELDTHRVGLLSDLYLTLQQDQENPGAVPVGTLVTVTVEYAEDLVLLDIYTLPSIELTDNGNNTYTFMMPDFDVDVLAVVGSELQGVTFYGNNWATYYGNYNLDLPSDVTAYLVTGVAYNEVQIEELSYIPKNTGVLLYSEASMDNITTPLTYYAHNNDSFTSLLQGSTEDQEISSGYGLYYDTFIRSQAGTLPAHRCYLPMANVPAGAPRVLQIKRPGKGDVITALEDINTSDVVSVKYVNMMGVVSDHPFDGVNIAVQTLSDGTTRTVKVVK